MANERYSEYVEASPTLIAQGLFEQSSVQRHRLGALRMLDDGRIFVYCKAGGSDLAAGKLVQAPAPVTNHTNCAVAANAAIGDRVVTLTLGNTAATANQYKDGFLLVNDATGEGHAYKIKSHPAAAGTANLTVTLYDKIRVALVSGTSEVTLVSNPYNGVIIHPSPPTARVVGVTPMAITAGNYFWCQCRGLAAVLIDGSVSVNAPVLPSSSVDGAVAAFPSTYAAGSSLVGFLVQNGVDTEYGMVDLKIL